MTLAEKSIMLGRVLVSGTVKLLSRQTSPYGFLTKLRGDAHEVLDHGMMPSASIFMKSALAAANSLQHPAAKMATQ